MSACVSADRTVPAMAGIVLSLDRMNRILEIDAENLIFKLTVAEDLDCSGLPACGEQVCTYDEGFIAGLLLAHTGREFTVKELDCWSSGDRVCRFEARPVD